MAHVTATHHVNDVLADVFGVIADTLQRARRPGNIHHTLDTAWIFHHERYALALDRVILLVAVLVFAYDLEGRLRWSRILEQDVVNAEAMPHGLLTTGEQGQLRLLDRDTGNDRWARDLGSPLASVAMDAAGFDPAGESGAARPLRESLNEMVLDPDNRLVAARA